MNFLLLLSVLNLSAVVLGDNSVDDFDLDIANLGERRLDSDHVGRISRGLRWEHDRPIFDTTDILDIQVVLLQEKIKLLKFGDCYEHGFEFGYKDDDLKKLELSILRLKVDLLENPHAFAKIVISIKTLEDLLVLLKEVQELKFKLKLCLIELKFDDHKQPLFKIEQLEKLEIALLKVKVALLKNPHDLKYADYTKEYLFKLKLAVLKLEIALFKNPFIFHFKYEVKDLFELIVDILEIKNGFPTTRFDNRGQRIQHGLRWENDRPIFDSDDILSLTVAFLKEKRELLKFDCIEHGFKFGYKDDDLELIKLSLLRLKVALLSNPHEYSPKLLLKIKYVEDLLELVEELIAVKNKLKPCLAKLIQLKFDAHDFPLFKIADVEKIKIALLTLKIELLDGFLSHGNERYTLKYLKSLEVAALKLKIALIVKPLLFGHHIVFDVDDFLKLVKEVIVLKEKFIPSHPLRRLSIRPDHDEPVVLTWKHNGYPLFPLHDLVRFGDEIKEFKFELIDVVRDLEKFGDDHVGVFRVFPYTVEELTEIAKKLLKLKVIKRIDPFVFEHSGGSRHLPLGGLVKIDNIVDDIKDVIDLLKKIFAPAPIKPPTKFIGDGKCSNKNDFDQLVKTWNLRQVTADCAKECHVGGANGKEDCVNKCVLRKSNVSFKCSTCFGEFATCAAKNCWFSCLLKSEHECQTCADRNCADSFEKCAFGSWTPNWKQDIGHGWRWENRETAHRRRTPFEGMDLSQ